MSTPRVSVVLPTHNRVATLARSIDSVLSQSFADFELLVVDDASTDGTVELLRSYSDERLVGVDRPARGGGGAARNSGILRAKADWIAFQDSDDAWLPEKLARQVELAESVGKNVAFIYTGLVRRGPAGEETLPQGRVFPEGPVFERLVVRNFVSTQTALVRRSALERVHGFDETLPRLQDWDLFLRLARHDEARAVKDTLVDAFVQKDSITADDSAYFVAYERILAKLGQDRPAVSKHHLRILARAAFLSGRRRKAVEYAVRANRLGVTKTDVRLLATMLTSEEAWDRALELISALPSPRLR
ncbi:MAG: glycosyltransferase [Deltaproteobacteria bacterium]|nr:glycosyltransferase [Deltaproteobacteria bacterium]